MPKSAITGEAVPRTSVAKDRYHVPWYKRRLRDDPHPDSASNALSEDSGDDTGDRERLSAR